MFDIFDAIQLGSFTHLNAPMSSTEALGRHHACRWIVYILGLMALLGMPAWVGSVPGQSFTATSGSKAAQDIRKDSPPASAPRVTPRSTYVPVPEPPDVVPESMQIPELPDEIRQQLPMISMGGVNYSADPTRRLLVINGQIFHEGDPITQELTLEKIELKWAVVKFKGTRYRLRF